MASDQTDRRNGLTTGLAIKTPVKAATTASLGAGASGLQIIDGYQTVAGDRVLRKNEADAKLNGIWNAAAGVWTRAKDCDGNLDLTQGTIVHVINGTVSARTWYELTTANPITIGTTSLTWTLTFLGASSTVSYTPVSGTFAGITTTVQVWLDRLLTAAATTGAALIGFLQAGTGSSAATVQGELRKIVRASQFDGADLGAKITQAIAALPSTGGIVDATDSTGAQTLTSKLTISKANVTVLFGATTLTMSGVSAVQSPFGAHILVTAANVWLRGAGGTVFKLAAGAEADCVTFLHGATLGGATGIEFDGNKANNTSIVDDSFQSAIQIISDSGAGATVDSRITVENCVMHDFNHYGVVTYGNLSNRNSIRNNLIYSNGKNDTNGTGDGIFINKGSGNNHVSGNRCYSNQRSGIRLCAVGVNSDNNKIVDNWCYSNTQHGIRSTEESNLGSTSGTGQAALLISGNHCYSNTKSGIHVGTFNNVGFIKNGRIDNNFCYSNTEYGILLQSNATTDNVRQTVVCGNEVFSNTLDGIGNAANVLDSSIYGNTVIGNANQIVDLGTRTLTYGNKTNITDGAFDLAVGQIKFPAAQNASTGVNTLDDYEEGTWTPTDGSGAALSFTVSDCQYIKIGQFVMANFAITYPATANGAGVRIAGLPFTSQNTSASFSYGGCISTCTFATGLTLANDANASTFIVVKVGGTQAINSELSGAVIKGSVFYRASA